MHIGDGQSLAVACAESTQRLLAAEAPSCGAFHTVVHQTLVVPLGTRSVSGTSSTARGSPTPLIHAHSITNVHWRWSRQEPWRRLSPGSRWLTKPSRPSYSRNTNLPLYLAPKNTRTILLTGVALATQPSLPPRLTPSPLPIDGGSDSSGRSSPQRLGSPAGDHQEAPA
jgi:hypothetical protein